MSVKMFIRLDQIEYYLMTTCLMKFADGERNIAFNTHTHTTVLQLSGFCLLPSAVPH